MNAEQVLTREQEEVLLFLFDLENTTLEDICAGTVKQCETKEGDIVAIKKTETIEESLDALYDVMEILDVLEHYGYLDSFHALTREGKQYALLAQERMVKEEKEQRLQKQFEQLILQLGQLVLQLGQLKQQTEKGSLVESNINLTIENSLSIIKDLSVGNKLEIPSILDNPIGKVILSILEKK